jgi:hypothetical protein
LYNKINVSLPAAAQVVFKVLKQRREHDARLLAEQQLQLSVLNTVNESTGAWTVVNLETLGLPKINISYPT